MVDLLQATSILYGDCSQEPGSDEIYIGDTLATAEQMTAINSKALELEAEYNLNEYSRLREAEYAKLNQDEMRFDDQLNGTNTWFEAIQTIKSQFPKPV